MNILKGIENFLRFINDNWTSILVIIGLVIGIVKKLEAFLSKSKDEQTDIAMSMIKEEMLKIVSDAEIEYKNTAKSGKIKRSKVIKEVYDRYPVLSKVVDQNNITAWLDTEIDNALVELRSVIDK